MRRVSKEQDADLQRLELRTSTKGERVPKVSVGRAELDTRPHILYRFYDRTGVLLYVGITVDFDERWKKHARQKDWWAQVDHTATKVEYCLGDRAARAAETAAIKAEKPLHNTQHNEFVEIETEDEPCDINEPWSLDNFVREVLDNTTEFELDVILHDNRHDFEGNERSDRGRDIAAAFSQLMTITWDRSNLNTGFKLLRSMLDIAEDNRWKAFVSPLPSNEGMSDYDADQVFMHAFIAAKAADYLDRLPEDEADQWQDCGRAIEGFDSDSGEVTVAAALYANAFKTKRLTRKGICSGPHHSGARCSRLDLVTTVFEVCPICDDVTNCCGHKIWCEKHDGMARSGRLEMYEDSRFARAPIRLTGEPGAAV